MSHFATENNELPTPHEAARMLMDLARRGMTFAEVCEMTGGRPSNEALAEMAATFARFPQAGVEFVLWTQGTHQPEAL